MTLSVAIDFADAWALADRIDGWLTECEGHALFEAAMQTPEDGVIVEVGSYKGRSLTLLAETGRRVIAVDPLELGMSIAKTPITEDTVTALADVVHSYPHVFWIRNRSKDTCCPPRIDLLYIDARHKYPSPLEDFRAFQDGLYPGAIVVFHDYGREFGVTKSVDELISGGEIEYLSGIETMFVGRYR